jgi:hypothetical protein
MSRGELGVMLVGDKDARRKRNLRHADADGSWSTIGESIEEDCEASPHRR